MASDPQSPCPERCAAGCSEGAMCPACFRAWERESSLRSLREWLATFGTAAVANESARAPRLRLVRA
jgi:hypothetical protein